MAYPKLAAPNLFSDVAGLKSFAMDLGFQGVDLTLRPEDLPTSRAGEARFRDLSLRLAPLEVRFHLYFPQFEIGHADPDRAAAAVRMHNRALDLIAGGSGRHATVHTGLARESIDDVSFERTVSGLRELEAHARTLGIRIALENLIYGFTSAPALYGELIGATKCRGTLDIGHAHVCEAVAGGRSSAADFARPHPERIVSAHVYHEEDETGHTAPRDVADIEDRLLLLQSLPFCDWWVIELREEAALTRTLACVREFLQSSLDRMAV